MLPAPNSSRRRAFRKPSYSGIASDGLWSHRLQLLSARSRVTNLAVLLLTASFAISLLLNVRHWLEDQRLSNGLYGYAGRWESSENGLHLGGEQFSLLRSIEDTIERPSELQKLEHLIVVPGHGVWLGNDVEEVLDPNSWALEHYQSGGGAQTRIEAFVGHVRKGVELADADPKSLLVFSGGATRTSTPMSESASYLSLSIALSLLIPPSAPQRPGTSLSTYERTTTEDHALDSFQNLLFSLARFRAVTGRYPARVTVVGYAMKESRFDELHRAALRWPAWRWRYFGIDMGEDEHRAEAMKGERANGYVPYLRDLYGCHESLLEKRRSRNVHRRAHPYHVSAPEIAALLEWCPGADEGERKVGSRVRLALGANAALDVDAILKNARDGKDSQGLVGETYTQVFGGPLPWDGL